MCMAFDHPPGLGYSRITRTEVRYKRVYAFAANRYADAATKAGTKFWRSIMDASTAEYVNYEMTPQRLADFRRYGR